MNEQLDILKNFIIDSINNPDVILDEISFVEEGYKIIVHGNCLRGFSIKYVYDKGVDFSSMENKFTKYYTKNPITIVNKIVTFPAKIIFAWEGKNFLKTVFHDITYEDCIFLCGNNYERLANCKNCLFIGW